MHSGECPETNLGLDPSIQVLSSSPSEPSKASKKVRCCCKKKDGESAAGHSSQKTLQSKQGSYTGQHEVQG